jgi:hypothetical protein
MSLIVKNKDETDSITAVADLRDALAIYQPVAELLQSSYSDCPVFKSVPLTSLVISYLPISQINNWCRPFPALTKDVHLIALTRMQNVVYPIYSEVVGSQTIIENFIAEYEEDVTAFLKKYGPKAKGKINEKTGAISLLDDNKSVPAHSMAARLQHQFSRGPSRGVLGRGVLTTKIKQLDLRGTPGGLAIFRRPLGRSSRKDGEFPNIP